LRNAGQELPWLRQVVSRNDRTRRFIMSDYRDPNDPLWRGAPYEPATGGGNVGWGWIAAALVLVVLVAIAFGVGHEPTRTASNDTSPAASRMMPPPANAPRPLNPANPGLTPPPAQQQGAQTQPQ
jgi:hypothetical protein